MSVVRRLLAGRRGARISGPFVLGLGTALVLVLIYPLVASRFDGVSMIRGMTQFTRTFADLSSRAKLSVRRFTPDLLAEYKKDSSSP